MNDSSHTTKKRITRYGHKLCFFIAIFIWICSLFQNGFTFGKEGQYEGFFVLIIGTIFGPGLGHIGYFAVYANYIWFILIFISLIRPQAKKFIFTLHGLLWVVALLTFTLNEVIVNEAGGHAKPTYGLGLYLWFTAFLLTTIAEFLKQRIYQNLKENTKRIK